MKKMIQQIRLICRKVRDYPVNTYMGYRNDATFYYQISFYCLACVVGAYAAIAYGGWSNEILRVVLPIAWVLTTLQSMIILPMLLLGACAAKGERQRNNEGQRKVRDLEDRICLLNEEVMMLRERRYNQPPSM